MTQVKKQREDATGKRLRAIRDASLASGRAAELKAETIDYVDDSDELYSVLGWHLTVDIPTGSEVRRVSLLANAGPDRLVMDDSTFCDWEFVDGYEAIWSTKESIIECELSGTSPFSVSRISQALRSKQPAAELDDLPARDDEADRLDIPAPADGMKISISGPSLEYRTLCRVRGTQVTIRIEGAELKGHDAARKLLEKVANSVLFQLEVSANFGAYLALARTWRPARGYGLRAPTAFSLQVPSHEYDTEAITLYWYGTTARGMPLLQYLAFYQVLEFYFPRFIQRQAQALIRDVLKDPTFDLYSDVDLNKIINASRGRGVRSVGDEVTQLKATIFGSVNAEELRQFLEADQGRKDFLCSKKGASVGVKQHVSLNNPSGDIRDDVANRIYEIRCRIVHTKNDYDESPLMLPFSREALALQHDLALIRYISREVLIAASRPLRL